MNTTSFVKHCLFVPLLLLAACGGGGGSTGGSGSNPPPPATALVDWTWLGGNETGGQPSIFGASGVVAASGVPGATEGASSWTDTLGNLWLFGGSDESAAQDINNLWKYDGTNWSWMNGNQGVVNPLGNFGTMGTPNAADASGPGARQYAATWTDGSNLWLFGGYVRIDAAGTTKPANDLWKYNIASRQWTWAGGASAHSQFGVYGSQGVASAANVPGARYGAVSWKDASGNFWLFGGSGYAESGNAGSLNDLWKFDGTNWTWVSGSKVINQLGSYGTQGASNASNIPSGRFLGVSWIDAGGKLWLFGGTGNDAAGMGDFNDLWNFNPLNNQWTWVNGDNKTGQFGNFGTLGAAATSNVPGARRSAVAWTDSQGNFWLFGGAENNPANPFGSDNLNDLWKYGNDPATASNYQKWVWMSGSNTPNQPGIYGTLGGTVPPESANVPGARDVAVSWSSKGKFWLFSGQVVVQPNNFSTVPYNDLWSFVPK
jgi:hypothetical protein